MELLITSIILTALLCAGIAAGVKAYMLKAKSKRSNKLYLLSLLGLSGLLLLFTGMYTTVGPNKVGIVYDELNGGIQDDTYGEGVHMKSIFEHITEISTANRSAAITTTGQTNDGQYATFDLSIIYKIKTEDAGKFYRVTNQNDIPQEALNTIVKASLQSSTIKYNIFTLLSTGLEEARLDFLDDLKQNLYETYFVTLVNVSFDDIDGGENVEQILQQKAEAEQKIEVAELEAQAALITATNKAEIERTLADAEAYAIRVEGEATGEAASAYITEIEGMINTLHTNMKGELTYSECTDIVLSIIFYDTWDGKLPEVLTSDSLSGLIGGLLAGNDTTTDGSTSGSSGSGSGA